MPNQTANTVRYRTLAEFGTVSKVLVARDMGQFVGDVTCNCGLGIWFGRIELHDVVTGLSGDITAVGVVKEA
ncbi:MAG TPA: hypothetical protein DE147_01365 [Gammaproteobacteria bacterium]|nr:hypothetical protein [Gammaproteobacteria bacterium]